MYVVHCTVYSVHCTVYIHLYVYVHVSTREQIYQGWMSSIYLVCRCARLLLPHTTATSGGTSGELRGWRP